MSLQAEWERSADGRVFQDGEKDARCFFEQLGSDAQRLVGRMAHANIHWLPRRSDASADLIASVANARSR